MKQGGISFLGALSLIFIVLKLTDNIDWSWDWVLAPIWIPACISLLAWVLIGFFIWNARRVERKSRLRAERRRIGMYD